MLKILVASLQVAHIQGTGKLIYFQQKEACTASCESECVALGHALKALLPLIKLVKECCLQVGLPADTVAAIHADVFEDNNACLVIATKQMLTSRTRWFHQRWHWFW